MTQATLDRPPIDMRQAEAMLQFIDGAEDRETWVAVGMALKAEFGDAAWGAWEQWSQQAANYSAPACRSSWRGFKSRAGGYTIGTIIKLAKDGGYRFEPGERPAAADLARRRAERESRAAADARARADLAANAEERALADWRSALREGESAYAKRKGIDKPESCRFLPSQQGGGLVLPMLRYDLPREQSLKGVQIIRDDGSKKFTYGMQKPGTACRLGLPVIGEPVFVCEGYATGMSIRMALERRYPVYVAWDAYNLPVVVESVYSMLPGCPIVICADDDWRTAIKGIANNVGRIQAQVAMDGVMDAGARLVVRSFPIFAAHRGDKDTDFNDLHRLEGLPQVRAQLDVALDVLQQIQKYG
jgi:putative DNA primase/helicase